MKAYHTHMHARTHSIFTQFSPIYLTVHTEAALQVFYPWQFNTLRMNNMKKKVNT